jgi:photosystem II stability/assembly factor-like uncharacterized protein
MYKIILVFLAAILHPWLNVNSQWVYQQVPSNASYYLTIEFPNALIGTAGGVFVSQNFSGRGAFTTNAGTSWLISQVPDSLRSMVEIKFVNLSTGYCAGAYDLDTTSHTIEMNRYDKSTFRVLPGQNIGLVDNYKGLFMKSTNSGQSWFTYGSLPTSVYYLLALHFVNSTTGFAAASFDFSGGVDDRVIKTSNAGQSWTVLTMPENINNLSDVYFVDMNTGFAVGYDEVNDTARGVILRTTNAGLSWSRQIFMELYQFNSVHFTNSSTGITVGSSNSIIQAIETKMYRTTNSGITWTNIYNYDEVEIQGIRFVSGTGTALIYGYKFLGLESREIVAKTTNYGISWTEGNLNDTGLILIDSELLNQNNWYLSGGDLEGSWNNPVILHTTNGGGIGIMQISSEIPESFVLFQNYPNPFNPATNIKFQIPKSSFVKLVIYDLLGREITVLVNLELKAGTYQADWNASIYPSGVYFYKLIADEYIETRKMVLVK